MFDTFGNRLASVLSLFGRAAARPEPPPSLEALGILLVDDEVAVLSYAELVLKCAGYKPVLASDGDTAIRLAATMPRLDLLVTDLMMPEMNGDELARRLRGRDPDLKVLYQTGFSDRLFAEKVILWDGEAFIEKPYSMGGLEEAVSLLLSGHVRRPRPAEHRDVQTVWIGDSAEVK